MPDCRSTRHCQDVNGLLEDHDKGQVVLKYVIKEKKNPLLHQ